jgi:hypothetical protein
MQNETFVFQKGFKRKRKALMMGLYRTVKLERKKKK